MLDKLTTKTIWSRAKCAIGLFCIGGILYNLIEIIWRGFTHWSMFFVGGACFHVMGLIHTGFKKLSVFSRCALCALAVTVVEFLSGCLFNLKLKMDVWDYKDMPFNIMGQVCLLYTVLWGGLSLLAVPVYRFFTKKLEEGFSFKWLKSLKLKKKKKNIQNG